MQYLAQQQNNKAKQPSIKGGLSGSNDQEDILDAN